MIQAVIAIFLALVAGLALQSWRLGSAHDELALVRAEHVAATMAAAESSRLKSSALLRASEGNANDTEAKLRAARTAAAVARNDLDRVRESTRALTTATADDPGHTACADDGRLSRLARLLSEGAGLVEEGGRRVEQLAIEKAGLQRDGAELRRLLVATPVTERHIP